MNGIMVQGNEFVDDGRIWNEDEIKTVTKNCPMCGAEFETNTLFDEDFCSHDCWGNYLEKTE